VGESGHFEIEHATWLHFLKANHWLPDWMPEMVPITWLVILILSATVIIGTRSLKTRDPGRFQTFLEFCVSALHGFVKGIVGEHADALTPIIGTFFILILSLNLFGLVPGFTSPTANINTTVAFALVAFLVVQGFSIRRMGVISYTKHFLGDPIWLAPLMLPIHIIGEIAKPLSLSIRLFGNIFGEDMVIVILIGIVIGVLGKFLLPFQFPMMLFAIFGSFVQALVFSMLVGIYIVAAIGEH